LYLLYEQALNFTVYSVEYLFVQYSRIVQEFLLLVKLPFTLHNVAS